MARFRDGTLNLLKTNSVQQIKHDLAEALDHCDLLGMQENTRPHVGRALDWLDAKPGWEVFEPHGSAKSNPIAWRTDVFEKAGDGWVVKVHGGHAKVTPARFIVCQPLRHKATGKTVLKVNAHCINGYARDNRNADRLRDRLAEDYWRTVVDVTWQHRDAYDIVLLSGDFNIRLNNLAEPWYPGHLLRPLYRFDHGKGIDHTLVARGSACDRHRHYRVRGLASDHDLHVQVLGIDEPKPRPEPEPEEADMTRIVTLEQWGSNKGRRATQGSHPIGSTKGITAHWEGPRMGNFAHSRCARLVRTIERFHEINRGWSDIAYNAVVCPHGYVFEGRGPGVRSAANGFGSVNDDWYAVCYLGGQGDGFTAEGKQGFLAAFDWLTREGNAGPGRNGHRDHKATACPGDAIYRWVHSPEARKTSTTRDWFDMATAADLSKVVHDAIETALPRVRFTVETSKGPKEWTLEALLAHIENEQDKTQALARRAARLADPERLADLVAARLNVDVTLTPDEVKQAVKDALVEGVGGV